MGATGRCRGVGLGEELGGGQPGVQGLAAVSLCSLMQPAFGPGPEFLSGYWLVASAP
jgi:hypothetical protein